MERERIIRKTHTTYRLTTKSSVKNNQTDAQTNEQTYQKHIKTMKPRHKNKNMVCVIALFFFGVFFLTILVVEVLFFRFASLANSIFVRERMFRA